MKTIKLVALLSALLVLAGCSATTNPTSLRVRLSNLTCEKTHTDYKYVANDIIFKCQGVVTSEEQVGKHRFLYLMLERPAVPGSKEDNEQSVTVELKNGTANFKDSVAFAEPKDGKDPQAPQLEYKPRGYLALTSFTLEQGK